MFSRTVAVASLVVLPLLAAATPVELEVRQSVCSVGSLQCCDSTVDPNSEEGQGLLGLLNIILGPIDGLLGMNCSPITVAGGSACNASPVCCTDNSSYDFIDLGCLIVTL